MRHSYPLSAFVRQHPKSIDSSLEKLTCTSQAITTVDIHPAALAALSAQASPELKTLVRDYLSVTAASTEAQPQQLSSTEPSCSHLSSACSDSSRSQQDHNGAPRATRGEDSHFNVALALSLHTVLLSRNMLTGLIGIVQFRNVVRLSLLGNHIRRIEDCEPLSLLPHLSFLTMEFNPVCALPHYRAHVLRIASWPKELSPRNCRLRKLDAKAVDPHDIARAMSCLQREACLLPELAQRHRLVSFATHVERTMRLHREMQSLGALVHETESGVSLSLILERCSSAALVVDDSATTDHLTRLLLAEQRRQREGKRTCLKEGEPVNLKSPPLPRPQSGASVEVVVTPLTGTTKDEATSSLSWSSASYLDVSVETRTSDNGHSSISVLDEVSEICLENLSWAKLSLSVAEQSQHDTLCEAWSSNRFRAALSALDIRLCSALLRMARMLGQALTSHDVDDLCRVWMHILSRHEPVSTKRANATGRKGKRSFVVPRAAVASETAAVSPGSPSPLRAGEAQDQADAVRSPANEWAVVTTTECKDPDTTADSISQVSSISEGGSNNGQGSQTGTEGVAALSSRSRPTPAPSAAMTAEEREEKASLPPSSALSETSPRCQIPVATERLTRQLLSTQLSLPEEEEEEEVRVEEVATVEPAGASTSGLSGAGRPADEGREAVTLSLLGSTERARKAAVEMFLKRRELGQKRAALTLMRMALGRRRQERLCTEYRLGKRAAGAGELPALLRLNLLDGVSRRARKEALFHHWRERAMEKGVFCDLQRRRVLRAWRRRAKAQQALHLACRRQGEGTKERVFRTWKRRACALVIERCAAAKSRVRAARELAASTESPGRGGGITVLATSPSVRVTHPGVCSDPSYATSASNSESPAGLSSAENAKDASPALPSYGGSPTDLHFSPPPSFDAFQGTATASPVCGAGALHAALRPRSFSPRAVVMPAGSMPFPERRKNSVSAESESCIRRARRAPSGGLVHSPSAVCERSPGSTVTSGAPFSEEDVAALVERTLALQSNQEVLVQRIIGLRLECEQADFLRSQAEAEAAAAQTKMKACEASLSQSNAEKDKLAREVKHLKQCVTTLREERREWLEQAFTRTKREGEPFCFTV